MAKPSEKTGAIERELDHLTRNWFGRARTDAITADLCVTCGGEATEFRDNLSRKEYTISGLCQKCQDRTFGGLNV